MFAYENHKEEVKMQQPKVGQRVVWKSPVPEERLRGQVTSVQPTGVLIKFDDLDPQKSVTVEVVTRSGGTVAKAGSHKSEYSFSWYDDERCFSEEEEN